MADEDKAKAARDRLEAAKAAASDAEIVEPAAQAASTPAEPPEAGEAKEPEATKAAGETDTGEANAAEEAPAVGAPPEDEAARAATDRKDDPEAEEKSEASPEQPEPAREAEPEPDRKASPPPAPEPKAERPLSALILQALLILIAGGVIALWLGPRIAPSLPGPIAAFLAPGGGGAEAEIEALKAELEARIAGLETRIDEADAARAQLAETASAALAAAEASGSAPASSDGVLEPRLAEAEAAIAALREEISDAPAPAAGEPGAGFGAVEVALAALQDDIAALRAEAERIGPLDERVTALESGEAATAGARDEAESIRRRANLDAALTRIGEALQTGAPFAPALTTATAISGAPAPATLAAVAEGGAPTPRALTASFPAAARSGYAAAVEAEAGEGFGESLIARLSGRIGGRPATETEGPGAGAVLSRIEARLQEGRLAAAAEEAAQLPEPAAAAMQGWLEALRNAVEAAAALETWRAEATANLGG